MAQKQKPKRQKPTKAKIKAWLKSKGHIDNPNDSRDEIELVAEAHGVLTEDLRRILK